MCLCFNALDSTVIQYKPDKKKVRVLQKVLFYIWTDNLSLIQIIFQYVLFLPIIKYM